MEPQNAPRDSNRKAGVRRDLRAAAIGGLAATFVVAASLAPKLLSHPNQVNVHNSSTESAPVESTTTTVDLGTTTTEAPATTTTLALEQRVTNVEHRVTIIEGSTTTTTLPTSTTLPTTTTTSGIPGVTATTSPPMLQWVEIASYEPADLTPVRSVEIPVTAKTGRLQVRAEWPSPDSSTIIAVSFGGELDANSPMSSKGIWNGQVPPGPTVISFTSSTSFAPPRVTVEEYR